MENWKIFKGSGKPSPIEKPLNALPKPPPWRNFAIWKERRGEVLQLEEQAITMVNVALYLRRPLLVTGPPGCGKSSLAYAVAKELNLEPVLWWPINSRSTVSDGLYKYDAVARLRDANLEQQRAFELTKQWREGKLSSADAGKEMSESLKELDPNDIGLYMRLGPLGTALLPSSQPKILLIDEIDKADIDLPNDLLHVFEEGRYEIPELSRITKRRESVQVQTETGEQVTIEKGMVQCQAFPVVILTSNGERDLPPAFLRRCLRLDLQYPDKDKLLNIIQSHLKIASSQLTDIEDLVEQFMEELEKPSQLATDQLLNAAFMIIQGRLPSGEEREKVINKLFQDLGG